MHLFDAQKFLNNPDVKKEFNGVKWASLAFTFIM